MDYFKNYSNKDDNTAKKIVLLTGAAGYIGSHCYYLFREAGFKVVVIDRLTSGHRWLLPEDCIFYEGDVADTELLNAIFSDYKISTVIHFAGSSDVAQSVSQPLSYFKNNTNASRILLDSCLRHQVKNFIFSSSASVYGNNPKYKVHEGDATAPENPYAISKLTTEKIINDLHESYGLNYVVLRYFNVAGADPESRIGHVAENATHLIKVACEAVMGQRPYVPIYGADYDTEDGTCIRDYIHVTDIARAHLSAYRYLLNNSEYPVAEVFNCGYGRGYSVRQIIETVEGVAGKRIIARVKSRRPGDPVALIADSTRLQKRTNWQPEYDDLNIIIRSALDWEKSCLAQRLAS